MATLSSPPSEDDSNYTQPVVTAGPQAFAATATNRNAALAEAAARNSARQAAINTFGEGTTNFVGVDESYIKIEGNKPPFTYVATYTTKAVQQQVTPTAVPQTQPSSVPPYVGPSQGPEGETIAPSALTTTQQTEVVQPTVVVTPPVENGFIAEQPPNASPVTAPQTIDAPFLDPIGANAAPVISAPQTIDAPFLDPIGANAAPVISAPQIADASFLDPIGANAAPVISAPQIADAPFLDPIGANAAPAVNAVSTTGPKGTTLAQTNTVTQPTQQDQVNFTKQDDWRVRLSLAASATYLYKASNPGILKPLAATNGVIFPYTPNIQVSYSASYDPTELVHSNYKAYQYKNSSVDNIIISCDFTAQDTFEANYLLAVIHFFKSVTKMFYGQDQNPKRGTPPPLCFLTGLGAFQFNEHPLAITSFTYNLPTDVDYIRAGQITSLAGVNQNSALRPVNATDVSNIRLRNIKPGGSPVDTDWTSPSQVDATLTYVPTKMAIQISAIPIISRLDSSNNFSLADYANGKLLRGIQNVRGGFW